MAPLARDRPTNRLTLPDYNQMLARVYERIL
jgi:hypothetical protein